APDPLRRRGQAEADPPLASADGRRGRTRRARRAVARLDGAAAVRHRIDPRALGTFAKELDVGCVFIDSLKDVALDLVKDETGSRVNAAFQDLIAEGIELVVLHHQRKQQAGGVSKPKSLADVYGSTWLTAGAGS